MEKSTQHLKLPATYRCLSTLHVHRPHQGPGKSRVGCTLSYCTTVALVSRAEPRVCMMLTSTSSILDERTAWIEAPSGDIALLDASLRSFRLDAVQLLQLPTDGRICVRIGGCGRRKFCFGLPPRCSLIKQNPHHQEENISVATLE